MTKDEQLTAILREIHITSALTIQTMQELNGIPTAQFFILAHLTNTTNTSESPSDLAGVFRVSKPAMTQLIQRMRTKKWIMLKPVPGDERRKQVVLTKLGANLYQQSLQLVKPKTERLASLLSSVELRQLFNMTHKLRLAVEQETSA